MTDGFWIVEEKRRLESRVRKLESAIRQHRIACEQEKRPKAFTLSPTVKTKDDVLHEILERIK